MVIISDGEFDLNIFFIFQAWIVWAKLIPARSLFKVNNLCVDVSGQQQNTIRFSNTLRTQSIRLFLLGNLRAYCIIY